MIATTQVVSYTTFTVYGGYDISPIKSNRLHSSPLPLPSDPILREAPRRLPFELFRPIIGYVQRDADLRALAVASRITQADAERVLHASLKAVGPEAIVRRCRHLLQYPRIGKLVRSLVLRDHDDRAMNTYPFWQEALRLPALYRLVSRTLRTLPNLRYLDASILPSPSYLLNQPFRISSFRHDTLVIGNDAITFFTQQPDINHLTLNPFSFYEIHHDEDHFRRLLYTILPSLSSLSCGLSVAIRLVKNRPIDYLVIPSRPDQLESDQLERVIAALRPPPPPPTSLLRLPHRRIPSPPSPPVIRHLRVDRVFENREGLQYITTELTGLQTLGIIVSYTSEWLEDLHTLTQLHTLSLISDNTYFDAHDPSIALDELRQRSCPSLSKVLIREHQHSVVADEWVFVKKGPEAGGEWISNGEVDVRDFMAVSDGLSRF